MSPAKKPAKKQAARSKGTGPKASAGASRTAKSTAKKTTSGKSTAKSSVKKTAAKKAPAKRTVAKKTTPKKAPVKKAVAKKTTPKKAPAKKTTAKKTTAKKATATKAPVKKTVAKKTSATAPVKKTTVRKTTARAAAKPPARPVQPTRSPRPAKLDKKQLAAIRERLMQEKAGLERQQSELDAEGTQAEAMAEIGLDDDFADAGTATFDRERDLSIRNNITDLIDQITRAVARIDDGTYGTCERCGRPIDAARLKALPHALLCLDCKRREERGR